MPASTNVKLILQGSLVLSAKENQTTGTVGILRIPPPGHELTIEIQKIPPTGPKPPLITLVRDQIRDKLYLNVTSAQPNITIRNKNLVDRKAEKTNQDSFNWFVDLEKASELYKFPIGADINEFNPLLTFNSGQLFSFALSENFLQVQKGIFSTYEDFGYVAVKLGIDFFTTVRTVFINGVDPPVFDSLTEPGTDYLITIKNEAKTHPPGPVTDANHYYRGLGSGISLQQRILFLSETDPGLSPPAGPEAACFPAYLSQSNIE